jgi:hypothetical protein
MALDTSGLWDAGDDLRIITVLKAPFGSYTLDCVGNCCNQLEDISPAAVTEVKTLLDQYDAAKTAQITADLADTEGKTLIKADVLEWQVNSATQPSGPQLEMYRCETEIANYFAFCSCLGAVIGNNSHSTSLIRS